MADTRIAAAAGGLPGVRSSSDCPAAVPCARRLITWGPPALAMAAVAAAAAVGGVRWPAPWLLVLFTALSAAGEWLGVPLTRGGRQTFNALVNFPAFIILGPVPAAMTASVGFAIVNLFAWRRTLWTMVFNIGHRSTSMLMAGYLWVWLSPDRPGAIVRAPTIIPALAAAALVFAANTTVLVSASIALRRRLPLRAVLRPNALWHFLPNVALAATGTVVLLMVGDRLSEPDEHVLIPLLIVGFVGLLYTARRQLFREFTNLHGMVTGLVRTLAVDDVLNRLAEAVQRVTQPDMFWIVLTDSQAGDDVVLARGVPPDVLAMLSAGASEAIFGPVIRRGPAQINDFEASVDYGAEAERVFGRGILRSVLLAPFMVGNEVLGAVVLVSSISDYYTPYEGRIVTSLAMQAALAVHNARLNDATRSSMERVAALEEVARMAAAGDDLDAIERTIIARASETLGAERGVLALYDEPRRLLVARAFHNVTASERDLWQTIVPSTDPNMHWRLAVSAQALAEQRPVAVADRAAAPGLGPAVPPSAMRATLAVPMMVHGSPIGTISLCRTAVHRWTAQETDMLQTLANEGALAIENARLYEQARRLSVTDGLTGLLNHRAFWDGIARELERAKRYTLPLSVVMVEIDKFKHYNDTYGHLCGDNVLRMIARLLEKEHRDKVDVVARYGGDEFILLLPHTGIAGAAIVAERIRRAAETTPFVAGDVITPVTLSLGVAGYPDDGDTAGILVDAADRRMYAAKRDGGNAVGTRSAPASAV